MTPAYSRDLIGELRAACEAWCNLSGCALATLSAYALNDGAALRKLFEGRRTISVARYERVLKWIADNPGQTWRDRNPRGRPPQPISNGGAEPP